MKSHFMVTALIALMLAASACTVTANTSPPRSTSVSPTRGVSGGTSATPAPQTVPTESNVERLSKSCDLLNSRDLASFFTSHAEVMLPQPQIRQVDHPIFSTGNAPGTETSCVYYTFHLPGSSTEVVLQVNYWVEIPASSAASQAWAQDWAQAKSKDVQALSGIGDDAFCNNGRLNFKKGDLYMTIEAQETDLDLKTPTGVNKQLTIEKQVALDMLNRLGS